MCCNMMVVLMLVIGFMRALVIRMVVLVMMTKMVV